MMNEQMTAADVLERAADLLERDGWMKFAYGGMDGPNCAAGAIARITGSHVSSAGLSHSPESNIPLALSALNCIAKQIGGHTHADVPNWNDADGRTAADVTSTMRACAALLRAQSVAPECVPEREHERV